MLSTTCAEASQRRAQRTARNRGQLPNAPRKPVASVRPRRTPARCLTVLRAAARGAARANEQRGRRRMPQLAHSSPASGEGNYPLISTLSGYSHPDSPSDDSSPRPSTPPLPPPPLLLRIGHLQSEQPRVPRPRRSQGFRLRDLCGLRRLGCRLLTFSRGRLGFLFGVTHVFTSFQRRTVKESRHRSHGNQRDPERTLSRVFAFCPIPQG